MTGPDRRRATIADVAKLAAVSKGTVSHVLSGRVGVSDALRARVDQAIQTLDYEPTETARSLTSRRRPPGRTGRRDAGTWPRLTTVGYVSVDMIAPVSCLPRREERLMSPGIVKALGGPAANVAAIAAGIGGPWTVAATLITALGVEGDSDWAVAELAKRRVDVVLPGEHRTGRLNRALVMVEADGRRTIVNEPSSLADVDVRRFVEASDPAADRPWCLHLEGYQVPRQIGVMARARERGFRLTMQATGLPPDWLQANAEALFRTFDIVMLHRETLRDVPGCPPDPEAALAWFAERSRRADGAWPAAVILTLGEDGAGVVEPGGRIGRAEALRVEVRDRTGAGDALAGAFLALWLNGVAPPLALVYACAAASLTVTRLASQELRPTAAELEAALSHRIADAVTAVVPSP